VRCSASRFVRLRSSTDNMEAKHILREREKRACSTENGT
jgi:hypothetical protein